MDFLDYMGEVTYIAETRQENVKITCGEKNILNIFASAIYIKRKI